MDWILFESERKRLSGQAVSQREWIASGLSGEARRGALTTISRRKGIWHRDLTT